MNGKNSSQNHSLQYITEHHSIDLPGCKARTTTFAQILIITDEIIVIDTYNFKHRIISLCLYGETLLKLLAVTNKGTDFFFYDGFNQSLINRYCDIHINKDN